MLEKISWDNRNLLLLNITKELIKNSKNLEILNERKSESAKEEVKQLITIHKKEKKYSQELKKEKQEIFVPIKNSIQNTGMQLKVPGNKLISQPQRMEFLRIPEQRLPPNLQYLKPTPTNLKIDLGKLNPLINDWNIRTIECSGENQRLVITNKMNRRQITNITLTREEIFEIINRFSEATKIPIQEGVFRVAAGNLMLSAIISELVGYKFIIEKMVNPYNIQ